MRKILLTFKIKKKTMNYDGLLYACVPFTIESAANNNRRVTMRKYTNMRLKMSIHSYVLEGKNKIKL